MRTRVFISNFIRDIVPSFPPTMPSFNSSHIISDMSFVMFSVPIRGSINSTRMVLLLMGYAQVVESLGIILVQ